MKRVIDNNNYIKTHADLICAFGTAIDADRRDLPEAVDLSIAAFELAAACGWDCQSNQNFCRWALNASVEEGLVEGLQRALAAVQAQYDAFAARREAELRVQAQTDAARRATELRSKQ